MRLGIKTHDARVIQLVPLQIFALCVCNLLVGEPVTHRLLHCLYPPLISLSNLVKCFNAVC